MSALTRVFGPEGPFSEYGDTAESMIFRYCTCARCEADVFRYPENEGKCEEGEFNSRHDVHYEHFLVVAYNAHGGTAYYECTGCGATGNIGVNPRLDYDMIGVYLRVIGEQELAYPSTASESSS